MGRKGESDGIESGALWDGKGGLMGWEGGS